MSTQTIETDAGVVTEAESDATLLEYERETGNCSGCFGKGQTLKRWSKVDGLEMQPCKKCSGTGNARGQQ